MNRKLFILLYACLFMLLIAASLLVSLLSPADVTAQLLDPTEQRETVNAMVEQRFTATIEALNLEGTADRIFADYLTATAMVDEPPPVTFTPTLEPIAITATFIVEQATLTGAAPLTQTADAGNFVPTPDKEPETAVEAVNAGWQFFWEERDSSALEAFDLAVELDPDWTEGYYGRGVVQFVSGRNEEAINDLSRAVELDDDEAGLYFERALIYDSMNEVDAAIEDYTRAIELNPTYVIARYRRGLIYRDEGDLELALDDFLAAVEGDPAIFVYYDEAAKIYGLLGAEEAEEFYTQIATGLGRFSSGEFDDAIERFDQALKVNADSISDAERAYVYFNRARVYRFTGENAAATEDYEAALELLPDLGHAYFEQHFMAQDEGDEETSLEMLDLSIENDPTYASPYLSRAVAYELDGEPETATPDFWEWIRLNQMREIDWTGRSTPGEPLIVEMGFGYVHRIPFSGAAGQPVSAEAQMIEVGSAVVDTLLVILDEDGNPIMANDDGGEGFNSAIAHFFLPEDGEYTLIVSHAGAGNSGPVEVNIKLGNVTPPATPTHTATPTITPTTSSSADTAAVSEPLAVENGAQ